MKTVVRIRRKGKVKDVGRRAMVTVPAAAEVAEVALTQAPIRSLRYFA